MNIGFWRQYLHWISNIRKKILFHHLQKYNTPICFAISKSYLWDINFFCVGSRTNIVYQEILKRINKKDQWYIVITSLLILQIRFNLFEISNATNFWMHIFFLKLEFLIQLFSIDKCFCRKMQEKFFSKWN